MSKIPEFASVSPGTFLENFTIIFQKYFQKIRCFQKFPKITFVFKYSFGSKLKLFEENYYKRNTKKITRELKKSM